MVDISIRDGVLLLEVEGLDKLWSFKGGLKIPLAHIKAVSVRPDLGSGWQWKGFRFPGTSLPGVITAGTFYQDGKRVFWDVHDREKTISIELHDERYDTLIVEVADPESAASMIRSSMQPVC